MPDFSCDFHQEPIPFDHFWEHTVGSGHAPLALRADYQAQLAQCHQELGFQHVRFHAILSDEMGTVVCQDEKYLFSFFNTDRIIDFLLSIGMRPFIELSFMPEALSSGGNTVFRYQANVTPPKNYDDWTLLIKKLVSHWVERYGLNEVSQWYFEVWNEPNLQAFWTGSQEDYFKLYQYTANTIKGIDDSLRVGGPVTAENGWIVPFLEFCQKNHVPNDFISTHYYPTDAFGKIGADTITQLANAPRDVMYTIARTARDEVGEKPLYYTEWNISSNPRDPLHDQPFSAAYIVHILMNMQNLVQGYSFWTFSDIFNENYFPSIPFHGGFGLLNLYGIPKPSYRAFEILHHLGNEMLTITGQHETVQAWVIRKGYSAAVLITNHAQPNHPIQTECVKVHIDHAPEPLTALIERIDEEHANPVKTWEKMGKPKYLSVYEVEQLKAASSMRRKPVDLRYENGDILLEVDLPPHAVAAITLEFGAAGGQ